MMRKGFLIPVLASLALLLVAVDVAQAQLRGRRTAARERRMERRGMIVTPTTSTSTTVAVQQMAPVAGSTVRVSYYPTPANLAQANTAQIRVILPDAKARVLFDDHATTQQGTDRLFVTPALTAGATNTYRIRATFMVGEREVTQERVLSAAPGMTYVLDFTRR